MSKIAEEKALEIYPDIEINWTMTDRTKERMIYADGYDQAMQDFLEKAEWFFNYELYVSLLDQICSLNNFTSMSNFVEYFKNYMKNEM